MKRFFKILFSLLFILIVVIAIKTFLFNSKQLAAVGERRNFIVERGAVAHLSDAIAIRTVSYDDTSLTDYATFDSLYSFLEKTYPLVFSKMEVNKINSHSLLLKWKGSTDKKPVIFYAHMDVVPADSVSWQFHPFGNSPDDKFIYGRGAIDDKGSLIAMLEAAEHLLRKNFNPSRDIYFAFGHDEEATGMKGAVMIAAELQRRKIKAEYLVDEGGLIATGMVPFVKPPVALVATSEKGYMAVELSVKGHGGHSSYPPKYPPAETIAKAIRNLHDHPFERRMSESLNDFMDYAGAEMSLPMKAVFANRWLFRPVVFNEYEKIPSANAMIRTTQVTTMINGGIKENVIPSEVKAVINLRLLPGDNSADVLKRITHIVDDTTVAIRIVGPVAEASNVSSVKADGFRNIQKAIGAVFPDVVVAPSLLIGQTDSRHFRNVTENIYRFLPVRMNDEILDGMHGANEKVEVGSFMEAIEFYRLLLSENFN